VVIYLNLKITKFFLKTLKDRFIFWTCIALCQISFFQNRRLFGL